jgi:DNA (cytosine-5)-methyltransferase 1
VNELVIQQSDDGGLRELALFAGAGGGILGGKLLGWRTICAVERDAYAAQVLAQRQNDGILEAFPIWSDVTTFDGRPWRGLVDVISAGFPCQDVSVANTSGKGIEGNRTGTGWQHTKRIIGEVDPDFVWLENSSMLTIRGLGTVLGELASLGFDAEWSVLSAKSVGARHFRPRIWILGSNTNRNRLQGREKPAVQEGRYSNNQRVQALVQGFTWPEVSNPHAYGSNNGLANRVDRTRAIGNGQVPLVDATAFNLLRARFE